MRRPLPLLLLTLLVSCGPADDTSSLVLSLDLEVSQEALDLAPDAPLRDNLGLYDLPSLAAYVTLEVTGDDMEPVTAEWPETGADLTGFDGTAVIELAVPPGDDRLLDGLVLSWEDGRARLFGPETRLKMDLAAGAVKDVELVLEEFGYGTISGVAPEGTVTVEIVDQVTDVILARAEPDEQGAFTCEELPAQRPLYPVWDLGDAERVPAPELATHIPEAGGGATFPDPS